MNDEVVEMTLEQYHALVNGEDVPTAEVVVAPPVVSAPYEPRGMQIWGIYYGTLYTYDEWGIYQDGRPHDGGTMYFDSVREPALSKHKDSHGNEYEIYGGYGIGEAVFKEAILPYIDRVIQQTGPCNKIYFTQSHQQCTNISDHISLDVGDVQVRYVYNGKRGSFLRTSDEISYKSVRTAIAMGNAKSKRKAKILEQDIKNIAGSIQYYEQEYARYVQEQAKFNKAREVIATLPPEVVEAIKVSYAPKGSDVSAYIASSARNVSSYKDSKAQQEKELATLSQPTKHKKAELENLVALTKTLGKVYTGPRRNSLVIEFNQPLVLHLSENSKETINYGIPSIYLEFTCVRGNTRIRRISAYSSLGKFVHPHITGERNSCLGSAEQPFINAYTSGNFPFLVQLVWKFLSTYNAASPLVRWSECKERMEGISE